MFICARRRNSDHFCQNLHSPQLKGLDLDEKSIIAEQSHPNMRCLHLLRDLNKEFVVSLFPNIYFKLLT